MLPHWVNASLLAQRIAGDAQSSQNEVTMPNSELMDQLLGYSLTTAEILYRLPDFPQFLQSFVWQDYDYAPEFPKLRGFLDYWQANLEGPLHCITVAHKGLVSPAEIQFLDGRLILH